MNYLQGLNERQQEAVLASEGPVIVLAGAGSGKTKTLITRVAHLIAQGVSPSAILAVTFTNKAAREMKERVGHLLASSNLREKWPGRWHEPWMGFSPMMPEVSTFHAFCVKLLRTESVAAGFQKPFVIYDDQDQLSLLKKILEQLGLSQGVDKARAYQASINQAKCQAWSMEEFSAQLNVKGSFRENIINVYTAYEIAMRENNALDFGDLIVRAVTLLKENKMILERYQERFRYLMVDEYQDTNRAQYLLISLLAKKYRNLCVVGDEDQSIYKWRGADIRNILDFSAEYPDAKMIKLEQNYRSTKSIIESASAVIQNNQGRYQKVLWTANETGEPLRWVHVGDEREEADRVSLEIRRHLQAHTNLGFEDIAIFYRSHVQSRALEEAFRKDKIPYRIVGGVGFYERKEIKDVLAYLRVLVNPDDTLSLLRIINVPARGIGNTTVDKIETLANKEGISFYKAVQKVLLSQGFLSSGTMKKIQQFLQLLHELMDFAQHHPVHEVYQILLEKTAYVQELQAEASEEANDRIENLEEFATVIQAFEENAKAHGLFPEDGLLAQFLGQITLESAAIGDEDDRAKISLMTLHSSKGLEFPLVFLVGCEEGLFPSRQAIEADELGDHESIEEERRLCYVGITRAKKYLLLTSAAMRRIHGQIQIGIPSRFLKEIPVQYLRSENYTQNQNLEQQWMHKAQVQRRETFYDYSQSDERPKPIAINVGGVMVGSKVRHSVYGQGVVRSLEGSEQDRKVVIEFNNRMRRKFVLRHVDLELL